MRYIVVLPCYNVEKYIDTCLASILMQRGLEFSIHVADDHSTDKTAGRLADWCARDDRVVLWKPFAAQAGPIKLRNWLYRNADCDVFINHDADDYSLQGRFAEQAKALESQEDLGLIASAVSNVTEEGVHFLYPWDKLHVNRLSQEQEDPAKAIRRGHCIVFGSTMIRAKHVRALAYLDETLLPCEDWDLFLRLSKIAKLRMHQQSFYVRRVHALQTSRNVANRDDVIRQICERHALVEFQAANYRGQGHVPGHPEI